jgi:hypothetical protein
VVLNRPKRPFLSRAPAILALAAAFSLVRTARALPAAEAYQKQVVPALETFCYKCHGLEKTKGGVNLVQYKEAGDLLKNPKVWQTVLQKLRDREMPPDNKPQPPEEERSKLVDALRSTLNDLEAAQAQSDPGRALIHRLSRAEYNNTVLDLFGVDSHPADNFPADGSGGGGFDNDADTLFLPPILMEKYLEAANDVLAAAARDKILVARPGGFTSERAAARKIAAFFAPLAFRRPVERAEIDRLLGLYDRAAKKAPFEAGVRAMLTALMVSPNFLFRVETDQDEPGAYRVTDYELASRLSYFLWVSMPDPELFGLARDNRLHRPEVVEAQVRRMLRDPKARRFADSFSGQWLGVKTLKTTARPDPNRFPDFNASLRDAMCQEPVEFFYGLLRDNRPVLDLISSDYSYLNETLARFYGVPEVTGPQMRLVKLSDPNRGGVLGMAGILTLTSYPQRTSPVLRGKWVLEQILGAPTPPPPPGAGGLPADDRPKEGLTFRQRLEKHRSKPECASCHKRMDPIGFGLENFDPIGRWRANQAGQPVDSGGEMSDGTKFHGPVELKRILLDDKEDFIRTLTEKALSYALGRGLEPYDAPAARRIAAALEKDGCRADTLILEAAKSFPFQYRRNKPTEAKL